MKEVYILAAESARALSQAKIKAAFETDEVQLVFGEDDCLFSVRADDSRVDVKFQSKPETLGMSPELLTGTDAAQDALAKAKGFYRFSFEPGKPQGSVAVFEALWCVRSLLEATAGVVVDTTAYKIHTPEDIEEITELDFDIRDHLTLHVVEAGEGPGKMWVHSHGMSKFGLWDVEMFALKEEDLAAAETFFHELCTDLAFGQGPQPRQPVSTSVGLTFTLLPCDEGRRNLAQLQVGPDTFDGHENFYLTIVSLEGRHTLSELLEQYRGNYEEETEEEATELLEQAKQMLPSFKARFLRRGLMEPLTFLVRAPFEVHPEGGKGTEEEQLWVEVLQWEEEKLVGKVVDGGQTTTEWRRGAHVEVEDSQINAIALSREGRTLDDDEMKSLLNAERPM